MCRLQAQQGLQLFHRMDVLSPLSKVFREELTQMPVSHRHSTYLKGLYRSPEPSSCSAAGTAQPTAHLVQEIDKQILVAGTVLPARA